MHGGPVLWIGRFVARQFSDIRERLDTLEVPVEQARAGLQSATRRNRQSPGQEPARPRRIDDYLAGKLHRLTGASPSHHNLPLLQLNGNKLRLLEQGNPGFDGQARKHRIDVLPQPVSISEPILRTGRHQQPPLVVRSRAVVAPDFMRIEAEAPLEPPRRSGKDSSQRPWVDS